MIIFRKIILIFVGLLLIFSLTACKKEGDAERAGKKIDRAIDDFKDKLKK